MPSQAYRLRIRPAIDTGVEPDALVITSIRTGTNPYIAEVPSGDGQEVDLLTGAVRTGAYVVEVVDAVIGSSGIGTLRVVTSQLYDGTEDYLLLENGDKLLLESGAPIELELNNAEFGRPHLLSRRAFIEVSTDNGATWPTVWQAGFLSNVTQIDAIRYSFTVSNTRRVEQTQRVFTWSEDAEQAAFPQRGCIIGGPVIGGFGAKPTGGSIALDTGGWEFTLLGSAVTSGVIGGLFNFKPVCFLSLQFKAGSTAPKYERKTVLEDIDWERVYSGLNPFVQYDPGVSAFFGPLTDTIWYGLTGRSQVAAYPNLTAIITDANGNTWRGGIPSMFSAADPVTWFMGGLNVTEGADRLFVTLYDAYVDASGTPTQPLPAVDSTLKVRIVSNEVTKESPLYFDLHPVDVVTKLYDLVNIEYKSDPTAPHEVGSAQWMKDRLGGSLRLAARITEPQIMAEFLEKAIFGPFGFATRTNAAGRQEFFITRELGGTIDYTINDADIRGDSPPPIWSLDEATAVTGFDIKQKQLTQWVQPQNTKEIGPADNIVETAQPIQYLNGDTTTFSTRIVSYSIPGMVHDASSFVPTIKELGFAIAYEGFERFGRGAPTSEIPILGTSAAAAAQVGDLVYLNAGYYPNKNYRIGESTVGPRVAQIVRRDEKPEGPVFKLVDAGVGNQPALPPLITIAASTATPTRVAQFTITNAGALNNTGEIAVAIEWYVSPIEPTLAGPTFARYEPKKIPVTAVALPPVVPGSTVWVRARTEQTGMFPSLWTAWQSVALTAWPVPASLAISSITSQSARLTWSNSGNAIDNMDVFLAPGLSFPPPTYGIPWNERRVTTLQAGSTSYTIQPLTASTNYIVGLAFVDAVSGARGEVSYVTFSSNTAAVPTASRPAGLIVIPGVADEGTWVTAVRLGIYGALGESNVVIQRAVNVVIGGVDTPGAFTDYAVRQNASGVDTFWDYLPADGAKYWYRIYHRTPGKNDSAPTPSVKATAEAVPYTVFQVSPVLPLFNVLTSESGTNATVTIEVEDPQLRLEQVRFRKQTNNGGWSAWTVDATAPYSYSATIPGTGFVEIEYEVSGFTADGVSRVIGSGIESFDVDTIANIVTAVGTYGLDGSFVLSIQADTDTNSFKYAFATTPWATDALAFTAAQAGTPVNGRNTSVTLTGPYAVGSTLYVAIAAYTQASYMGTVSGPYRYSFLNGSRDTIPLMGRARVTGTTDTTVTVRYAVACPVAPSPNTVSIAYSSTGVGTITPASPQTITPQLADVVTETAGSYSDFTIDRPLYGQPSGRVTFTATATGRVADTDSVDIPATGLVYSLCQATQTASDATSITVQVDATAANGTPQVKLKSLAGTATRTSGAAVGTLVASGSSWTFARGGFNTGPSQAEFEAVLAGAISDSDLIEIPEQGRDTVPLVTRARVTGTTATTVTVRVAVADPYPQGTDSVSLAYQTLGLGTVTPSSPQDITPAATLTEAAGTYVDFTVPRPAAGAGMGRITFTATAANRVADADAVDVVPSILVYSLCEAVQTGSNATTVSVTVSATADNGTPQVRLTALNNSTIVSGAALNTLVASPASWVFNRPAFETGQGQAEFESVLAGAITDTDLFSVTEQGRDTVPLIARARVTAVDANDVTVRVAVADPYPQGTNSATIAYSVTGLSGVSPATGQTVTPASTLTEAAGTYVDFTVPRPTNGATPGRITFTATAANRTSDSDAADIVPKNPVPASLDVTYTIYSDSYVISWVGGSGTTVTVSINGGAYGTPSASPITVSRNLYTETDKVYTFKGTGTGGDIVTNTVVVARQDPVIPNLPQISYGYFSDGYTPGDGGGSVDVYWVDSDMPVGVTYDIYLTDITGDPITASSASDLGNLYSPVTVSVALGPGAEATCTIEAYDGATLVATYSFRTFIPL